MHDEGDSDEEGEKELREWMVCMVMFLTKA